MKSHLGTLKGKEKKKAENIIASFETNFYKKAAKTVIFFLPDRKRCV